MKIIYTLATVLFLATTTTLFGQYSYQVAKIEPGLVPQEAVNAFDTKFPGTKVIRWEKHTGKGKNKSHVKYVVIFDREGIRSRARYKANGTGISATTYYWFKKGVEKLPQKVKDYADSNHPGFKLNSGEKVMSLASSEYVYRIRLRKGASRLAVYVNDSGEALSKNSLPSELTEDEKEQ